MYSPCIIFIQSIELRKIPRRENFFFAPMRSQKKSYMVQTRFFESKLEFWLCENLTRIPEKCKMLIATQFRNFSLTLSTWKNVQISKFNRNKTFIKLGFYFDYSDPVNLTKCCNWYIWIRLIWHSAATGIFGSD